ncbi:MAG: glycosyltransferase [Anaerolineales bacterium]|nr:glycosyltransferase [Anaerolineales bacterium]
MFAFLSALFSKDILRELKKSTPEKMSLAYLKRLFFFLSGAKITQNWVLNWLAAERTSAADVICYTYWFTEISAGLGWAKRSEPQLRLISRVHGYDLYEEKYKLWPLRLNAISLTDGLFADSDIGANYLKEKYPQFKEKYQTALLGVKDPNGISSASQDGALRLISCSSFHFVKRIDLLFEGVVAAAKKRPTQKIAWTHFGGAEEIRKNYMRRALNESPANLEIDFPGYQSQRELIQTYLANPIDVFLNVSSTEGTSVAMMEAVSCGIPLIATAVGGNVEIVQKKNGLLLNENPTPDEIADALFNVCDNRETWLEKRKGSRDVWQKRYNETTNFEAFAQTLVEIRKR